MQSIIMIKTWKDLFRNKGRALLTSIAMIFGIMSVGSLIFSNAILVREMDENYMKTNPASAHLYTTGMTDEQAGEILNRPDIRTVELRGIYGGRFKDTQGFWKQARIYVIPDFLGLQMNIFYPEKGAWPPGDGEILLERSSVQMAGADIGDTLTLTLPGKKAHTFTVSGIVHNPGYPPSFQEQMIYVFMNTTSFGLLEESGVTTLNELSFMVKTDYYNLEHAQRVTEQVKAQLEAVGVKTVSVDIPFPGKHPHWTQMQTMVFLILIFGILSLMLSAILVINLVSSMISRQVTQIGIMKALGARPFRIIKMYSVMVLVIAVISVCIGLPCAVFLTNQIVNISAYLINFNITSYAIPLPYIMLVIALGLVIPLLAALYPMLQGAKITVREALFDYGLSKEKHAKKMRGPISYFIEKLPRIGQLIISNTFRGKGKVALSITTLALGGAMFMTALNVGESINQAILAILSTKAADLELTLQEPAASTAIDEVVNRNGSIADYEIWQQTSATVLKKDGLPSSAFPLYAPASHTKMFAPRLIRGTWYTPTDTSGGIVPNVLIFIIDELKYGKDITLSVNGKELQLRIVGLTNEMGSAMYVSSDVFARLGIESGKGNKVLMEIRQKDKVSQEQVLNNLIADFEAKGMVIKAYTYREDQRRLYEGHFWPIIIYLLILSILILVVGIIGLISTVSTAVLERSRELGVMRALGARGPVIRRMITAEGLLMGIFSWLLGLILSFPLSLAMSYGCGYVFFRTPLPFVVTPVGLCLWLIVIVLFSLLAGLVPANKTIKLPISETLAYE